MGEILDISASGARILRIGSSPLVGDTCEVELEDGSGVIKIDAVVVWTAHAGRDAHEVGLEFREVTPEGRAALIKVVHEAIAQARRIEDAA